MSRTSDDVADSQAPLALARLLHGGYLSQAIYVAARLGIPDQLADGALTSAELAGRTGADAHSIHRLMRSLAAVDVFRQAGPDSFELAPIGRLLRASESATMRPYALVLGELQYEAWGDLLYTIQTGRPAYPHVAGKTFMEHLQADPQAGKLFTEAMRGLRDRDTPAFVAAYDFSGCRQVVDVGGANGALLIAILKANPSLHGVLLDLPQVAEGARKNVAAAAVDGRCEVVGGDFSKEVPAGGDVYILSRIVQGLDDAKAVALLTRCREAMSTGGRVLVSEVMVDRGDITLTRLQDLQMLVIAGGGLRTEGEHTALLARAGLTVERVIGIPAAIPHAIVEGVATMARS